MRGFSSYIFTKIASMLTLMCGKASLKKEMAAHSRILAWRNPWTEEPSGLQPIVWSQSRTCLKWLAKQHKGIPIKVNDNYAIAANFYHFGGMKILNIFNWILSLIALTKNLQPWYHNKIFGKVPRVLLLRNKNVR